MSYAIRIVRYPKDEPISLDEWKRAVSSTDGVRLCSLEALKITNPQTGEIIGIPIRDGDTEVYFPDEQNWHPIFRWSRNSAQFNAGFEFGDSSHPIWRAATVLANRLNAGLRGDEGEYYNLETGAPI